MNAQWLKHVARRHTDTLKVLLFVPLLSSILLVHEQPPEQYPPPLMPHPQQLIAPIPALVKPRVITLTTPSPNTNPLATTITNSGVSPVPVVFAAR